MRQSVRLSPASILVRWSLVASVVLVAHAQTSAPIGGGSTGGTPTTAPTGQTPLKAKVIEVVGDVSWAPLDAETWQPVKMNDEYGERTRIRTGIRSSVKFQIGDEEPYTCLLVDSIGKTVLSQAYKTAESKVVRVGVAHGRVRAGVAEGGLKSDFTVDSPVATLSKRGTWGFSLYYERETDLFEIGLTDYGLVQALNRVTGDRRNVQPGQHVTQAMRRWLDQAALFRNVPISDIAGQSDTTLAFNRLDADGLGVTQVGSGRTVLLNLANSDARNLFANLAQRSLQGVPAIGNIGPINARARSEAFFGTGRGEQLIPVLIDAKSDLAQRGLARPGEYRFRRDALESWLGGQGRH